MKVFYLLISFCLALFIPYVGAECLNLSAHPLAKCIQINSGKLQRLASLSRSATDPCSDRSSIKIYEEIPVCQLYINFNIQEKPIGGGTEASIYKGLLCEKDLKNNECNCLEKDIAIRRELLLPENHKDFKDEVTEIANAILCKIKLKYNNASYTPHHYAHRSFQLDPMEPLKQIGSVYSVSQLLTEESDEGTLKIQDDLRKVLEKGLLRDTSLSHKVVLNLVSIYEHLIANEVYPSDISPGNFVLERKTGHVTMVDFGGCSQDRAEPISKYTPRYNNPANVSSRYIVGRDKSDPTGDNREKFLQKSMASLMLNILTHGKYEEALGQNRDLTHLLSQTSNPQLFKKMVDQFFNSLEEQKSKYDDKTWAIIQELQKIITPRLPPDQKDEDGYSTEVNDFRYVMRMLSTVSAKSTKALEPDSKTPHKKQSSDAEDVFLQF